MAQFDLLKFAIDVKKYNQPGAIVTEQTAIGYHFVNTGSCIVFINQFPLYPSGILDTMYIGCKDVSKYTIRFDTSVTPIPNPELTVITFNQSA
jgi:hypothetical protein